MKDISKLPNLWPKQKPNLNFDNHGWFSHQSTFELFLNKDTKNVCELGSWLGSSTRCILELSPSAKVFAIDHWSKDLKDYGNGQGAKEGDPGVDKISTLFEQFVFNCWDYKERLHMVRGYSHECLKALREYEVQMDVVYIDASHRYEDVYKDIELSIENWPKAQIIGDDYSWDSVKTAVHDYASKHNKKVVSYPSKCWSYEK